MQPAAISHFETGRRSPSFDNLRKLADALEVSTDYLLGRADRPNESVAAPAALARFGDLPAGTQKVLQLLYEELLEQTRQGPDADQD